MKSLFACWDDPSSITSLVIFMYFSLTSWSESHKLRYQVVRSWRGSSCTPWHMRCTTWVVLNLPWSFMLDSLIIFGSGLSLWYDLLNTGLSKDVSCYYVCWIFGMCRSMWLFYVGIRRRLNNFEIDSCNLIFFSFGLIVHIIELYFH